MEEKRDTYGKDVAIIAMAVVAGLASIFLTLQLPFWGALEEIDGLLAEGAQVAMMVGITWLILYVGILVRRDLSRRGAHRRQKVR